MFIVNHQHNEKSPQDQHVAPFRPESSRPLGQRIRNPRASREARGLCAETRDLTREGLCTPTSLAGRRTRPDYATSPVPTTLGHFCYERELHPLHTPESASAWRRARDSNPRCHLLTQRFSRPSLSATRDSLQTCPILQEQAHTRDADGTGTGTAHPAAEGETGSSARHI